MCNGRKPSKLLHKNAYVSSGTNMKNTSTQKTETFILITQNICLSQELKQTLLCSQNH